MVLGLTRSGSSGTGGAQSELTLSSFTAADLLEAGFTFTRASAARGSDFSAFSNNTPRFDSAGLLIEGARTNAILSSNDATPWGVVSATITPNYGVSPFGGTTSNRIVFAAAGGFQQTSAAISGVAASTALAYSTVLKGTGTLHLDSSLGNAAITLTNAFTRYGYNGTDSGGNTAVRLISYGGDTATDFEVAHLQAEAAAFRSSAIVTTGSPATRAAETCIGRLASGPSSWVWVFNFTTAIGKAGDQVLAQADDGTADNRITIRRTSGGAMTVDVVVGGSTVASINAGTMADATSGKIAIRIKLNDMGASLNGAPEVVDNTATVPPVTTLRLGHDHTPANHWFGSISKVPALGVWRPSTQSLVSLSS